MNETDYAEDGLFADEDGSGDNQERPPMLPALSPVHELEDPSSGPGRQEKENEDPKEEALPKPRVRKSVPLLNDERLTDKKRGLAYLVKEFPKIKFKGKGHEASDVRRLMRYYEHWANRLFPKYPFDKFLLTLEGPVMTKARVKSCITRLRHGEFEDDNEVHSGDENQNSANGDGGDHNAGDAADQMADFGEEVRTADPPLPGYAATAVATPTPLPASRPSPSLTDDALEQIRLNRERAMARLAARRAAQEMANEENDSQGDDQTAENLDTKTDTDLHPVETSTHEDQHLEETNMDTDIQREEANTQKDLHLEETNMDTDIHQGKANTHTNPHLNETNMGTDIHQGKANTHTNPHLNETNMDTKKQEPASCSTHNSQGSSVSAQSDDDNDDGRHVTQEMET